MKVEVIVRFKVKSNIPAAWVEKTLKQAADYFKKPKTASVSVVLIGDKEMCTLNCAYRNKDKTTNVLSFPTSYKLQATSSVDLGDIFICYPEAKREAKKYHFTLRQELDRLLIHGFLHLMGYDHIKAGEAKKMEKLEIILCSA